MATNVTDWSKQLQTSNSDAYNKFKDEVYSKTFANNGAQLSDSDLSSIAKNYGYGGETTKALNATTTNAYTPTDYSDLQAKANQAPATYNPYDYSGLQAKANQAPLTYTKTNYDAAKNLASQVMQAQSPGSVVDYSSVLDSINKANTTMNTADFQSPEYVTQAASKLMELMKPIMNQQNAQTNQQYNNSSRALEAAMAARGLGGSGTTVNQMIGLEQARNSALTGNYNNMLSEALAQVIPQAQLALSEKELLQGQASNYASQLASLLGQQTSAQQWAQNFNANQKQNQFANTLASLQAEAGENQFGASYAADQAQNQFSNLFNVAKAQAAENQYGQGFNADQLQNQFSNLLGVRNAQSGENQFAASYGLDAQQLAETIAQNQRQNAYNQGVLTGTYDGQQTLAAREFAEQMAQNQRTNNYNNAVLTGQMTTPIDYSGMTTSQLADAFNELPSNLQEAFGYSDTFDQYNAALRTKGQGNADNILRSWLSQNAPTTSTQTLAARELANSTDPNSLVNRIAIGQLTGTFDGQDTIAKQSLNSNNQQALNQLAAGIMAAYAQGTDQFTLPESVTNLIDSIFKQGK